MIYLKKKYDLFNTNDFNVSLIGYSKTIHFNSQELNVTVIGNFDVKDVSVSPQFQHSGYWYNYFKGDSTYISDTQTSILLQPGEYRIYFDKRIIDPDAKVIDTTSIKRLVLYPNPAKDKIVFILPDVAQVKKYFIYNIEGELICIDSTGNKTLDISSFSPGVYIIKVIDNRDRELIESFVVGKR